MTPIWTEGGFGLNIFGEGDWFLDVLPEPAYMRGPATVGSLRVVFKKSDGSTDNIFLDSSNRLHFETAAGTVDPIDVITV